MLSKLSLISLLAVANAMPGAQPIEPSTPLAKRQDPVIPGGDRTWDGFTQRSLPGNVPYGDLITNCVQDGVVALTFDDGPSTSWTPQLLDFLKARGVRATFFITGKNEAFGGIDQCNSAHRALVERTRAEGHQIAHHTWTHANMTAVSQQAFDDEFVYTEMAFRNIFGYVPTYFRPPSLEWNAQNAARAKLLGYHVISRNIETLDWANKGQVEIRNSINMYNQALTGDASIGLAPVRNGIALAHDIHEWSVKSLAPVMVISARNRGLQLKTVGECLGDPEENWYRTVPGAGKQCAAPPTSVPLTPDGSCGPAVGFTCQGSSSGNCCSKYGWCGATPEYCTDGCQGGLYGTCG